MQQIYKSERIIGHHVQAELDNRERPEWLQKTADELNISLREWPDCVRITEGDVDWDESREVRVTIDELREIALEFTDLERP